MNIAFPLDQAQPCIQLLAAAVKQPVNQGPVGCLAQHVMQSQVCDKKMVHGAAQIITFALTATGMAMQIRDGEPEFLANI